jgi:hypothetical protein
MFTNPQYRRLDAAQLRPGDVILTSDQSRLSLAIQTFTWSDISHAMIYGESHSIIDANSEGVRARNTQRPPRSSASAMAPTTTRLAWASIDVLERGGRNRPMKAPPGKASMPTTSDALRDLLEAQMTGKDRERVEIVVMDLSKK